MDLKLFESLMVNGRPSQHPPEWRFFLELCEMFVKKHKIKKPLVVELGVYKGRQKPYWVKLLNAEHIGIDISTMRSEADIVGDTHDRSTIDALKKKLNGRPIDILFVDAGHAYDAVKKDYEMYAPLCNGIVALHDIETLRNHNTQRRQVWRFWDELLEASFTEEKENEKFMFLPILQCHAKDIRARRLGIGVIIKK